MKKIPIYNFFIIITIILFCHSCDPSSQEPIQELTGAYFNKTFPSSTVTRFAPDIFNQELHAPPIFSPDGTEVYWNYMDDVMHNHIQFMKIVDGVWTEAANAPFSVNEQSDSPFISSDGNKLVFLSSLNDSPQEKIWIVEKNNGEWGNPIMLGDEINWVSPHWEASIADNQNLYFGAEGDIYFSKFINGNYTTAQRLGPAINKENVQESSVFIAPDESYMIFGRVLENNYSDLFISFKQNDGSWNESVNMTELNTYNYHELYANVSPDGRFLMFLSQRSGGLYPYWVDASIIDNYRN